MTEENDPIDTDFDALEALLHSARAHARRMQKSVQARQEARSAGEVSEDYASRLAERATFRRLLSDEALDGVRFRWIFSQGLRRASDLWVQYPGEGIDALRKMIDEQIAGKEGINGPSS